MGDGRTNLFRNMWTKTTTNDVKKANWEYSDTTVKKIDANSIYDLEHMPDQRLHRTVSFIKSAIRIAGCVMGITSSIPLGFVLLLVAEIVGIVEELV